MIQKKVVKRVIGGIVILGVVTGLLLVLFEDEHVAQGRKLYTYYCADCHGAKGRGDGYNAENLDPLPRDHTDRNEVYMADRTNEELFEVISKGGREVSKSPYMPLYGHTLSEEEIWSLVTYLRTLHPNNAPKVQFSDQIEKQRPRSSSPEGVVTFASVSAGGENPSESDATRQIRIGRRFFEEKYACKACHRIGGSGGVIGPELDRVGFRLQPAWIYRWIKNPQRIKPHSKMPNFGLSDRDALALTHFLISLKESSASEPIEEERVED